MTKLRVDIRPYFPRIANYYWDNLDPASDGSIWVWLKRDYDIVKIGSIGDSKELWVHFPDEKMLMWFKLRWL
jgi:hypothetical protein